MKAPDYCKNCQSFWTHGIKDGKHNVWCTKLSKPAAKAIRHCKLHDMRTKK